MVFDTTKFLKNFHKYRLRHLDDHWPPELNAILPSDEKLADMVRGCTSYTQAGKLIYWTLAPKVWPEMTKESPFAPTVAAAAPAPAPTPAVLAKPQPDEPSSTDTRLTALEGQVGQLQQNLKPAA